MTDLAGARVEELTNLRDLSERGVAFYTNTRLEPESIITLELNVPVGVSGRVIPASARVARITRVTKGPYLVGAEFTEISTRDRALLRRIASDLGRGRGRLRRTTTDERRFPRARLSVESDVWVDTPSGPTHLAGRFVVLGAGGACLELDEPFSIGNLFNLSFTLPQSGDTISCRAIVRSAVEGQGVGVEFSANWE